MMEQSVIVSPSYDWRRDDPHRNYGVRNCEMTFILKGPLGAIQWRIGTEWAIKPVRDHLAKFSIDSIDELRQPKGWDLGYHSPTPMYDGQLSRDNCPILGLNADLLIEGFLARGTEWLWPKLMEYYRCAFEKGPWPDFTAEYLPHPDDRGAP